MRRNDRQFAVLAMILVLTWLTPHPSSAQTEDPYAFDDEYQSGDFGRVTYQENGVSIHRAMADPGLPPVSEAGVNSPVYPGDALVTSADQRVEVQVASGSLIRIDRATDVTFLSLPDPYAEFPDNTVLQLAEGTLRIATRLSEDEEFRIDTPSSSIYFLGDGDFRVEVTPGGRTEVISRRGVAEVVGNGGSILVQGGMRTEIFPGTLPEEAWAFNTFVADHFDRWVDERDAIYRVRDRYPGAPEYSAEAYEALPEEVQPYYQELSYHGDWTYVEEYGHVWYPSAAPADWRPYYDGYWDYGPGGYFWVSNEPWGWAPYHYGRWNWVVGYGWCWVPGRVFSGAWVAWSWGSAHIGWAPIDYWGRPCRVRGIYYGYYDPYAWTFVGYEHVAHRNYHRHAVRIDDIGADIRHARVVTRPPRVSPKRLATSREARSRAMRMVENDGAGRMRPVDRTARPSQTMRDVEKRIRGRSTPRGRDGSATVGDAERSRTGTRRGSVRSGETAERTNQDRRSTARGGNYPSYPRRTSQERAPGTHDERRNVGRRSPESTRRNDDRSGTKNSPPSTRVRPRETERAGTDQRVRDLYRKMASPRSTRDGGTTTDRRQPTSSKQRDRSTRSSRGDSERRSQSTTTPKRPSAPRSTTRSSTPKRQSTPRSTTRSSTPKQPSTPRSTTRSSRPKQPSTPRSTTRSSTPKRPSTPRSTTRSSTPKRQSTPRPTTRSSTPKRQSTPRSTGSKSGSSSRGKSNSGGNSKRKSDGQSSGRGKKR